MSATLKERFDQIHDGRNMRCAIEGEIPVVHQARLEDYSEPGHLIKLVSYINSNATLDDEDLPKGTLHIYHPDAKVKPDALPNAFQYLVVTPIKDNENKPEGYKDTDFDNARVQQIIESHVAQYSDTAPSLHHRNVETNEDVERWAPELGQEHAFAGIYKKMLPNQRDAKYYIAVRAGAPKATQELKAAILNDPNDMTFGELVEDPRLAYVQLLARRNAKRIAAELAFQMGVKIDKDVDHHAYAPTRFMGKPYLAEPTRERDGIQQSISSIQSILYAGQPAVAVYHHVRPVTEARQRNYVTSNPYNGITVFNMDNQPLGFAVPATTGLKTLPEHANLGTQIARRHRGMLFEPATPNQQYLKELGEEVHYAVDDEFLRGMHQVGWKQDKLNCMFQLVPVVVKVANVEKKRTH